jgi:hypothetical protein
MAVYRAGQPFQVMCRRNSRNQTIRKWHAVYKCGCGASFVSRCEDIKNEANQSCGCERAAALAKAAIGNTHNKTHGKTKTREYKIWSMMKERCLKPSHKSFGDYGGRGITICKEWINSFKVFVLEMGECPAGMSIERKDTNGPYEKENCVWATRAEQDRNKRNNVFIEIDGERKIAADWAVMQGAAHIQTIYQRVNRGIVGREAVFGTGRRNKV